MASASMHVNVHSTESVKVAIVGCGQIVTHHITALTAVGTVQVHALCDPSSTRRTIIRDLCAEKTGLISASAESPLEFDSLDELIANAAALDEISVIFIAVPHDLHVKIASQALTTGKHVVLEKPLAPTIDQCKQLQQVAATASGLLIVAEQSPYWQEIQLAKKLLQEGQIGTLVTAASYFYESMRDNVTSGFTDDGGLGWRASLERCGGGIVIDGGLHWIRPLREICGDVLKVVGVTQNADKGLMLEGETLAHALFQISGGLIATYSANNLKTAPMAHDTCPMFRFTGTKGELVVAGTGLFSDGGGGLRLYNEENPEGKDLFPKDRQGGFFLGFEGLWRSVLVTISNNDRQAARKSVRDAAADVGVALALYQSSATGQWIDCELCDE